MTLVLQIGFGPGFGDMKYYKKHLDDNHSKILSSAIIEFLMYTDNSKFENLYDSTNKNKLNIKQNDPDSVIRLIEALQDKIYYKNQEYGPYLRKTSEGRTGYDLYRPRSSRNAAGYRIEIINGYVNCFPVCKKSDAVIIIINTNDGYTIPM